jgi:hypothetical protein
VRYPECIGLDVQHYALSLRGNSSVDEVYQYFEQSHVGVLQRPGENMFTRAVIFALGCSVLVFGCGVDQASDGADDVQETIENLQLAGFPEGDIRVLDGKVYVGNDAEVSLQSSREMLQSGDSSKEQYRTFNLVAGPNPTIICVNGAAFVGAMSTGLDFALGNYNALFFAGVSRLGFARVAGGPVPGCNFFINGFIAPGLVGGSAGFPAGGAPFPFINIGDGLIPFGVDVIEHVITHELGHTIGFRHSDWFNRAISCGGAPINEENPPSGLGAIHIPFTPVGAVLGGSLMNSCFRAVETGEFNPTDVTAIDVLY